MISVTVSPRSGSSSRAAPGVRELLARVVARDELVVGIEHRDQAGVGRALHVVLAAQRVQPGALPAHVPGDRAHRDQAARVVGAGRVLRDPHAPVDDRGVGGAPQPRDLADRVGVHAADLRGALGRVLLHDLRELAVVRDPLGDELAVDPVVRDHLVQDPVVEGHVRAGLELAVDVGVVGDPLAPRVHHDQLRAAPLRLLEEARRHRVVRGRVRAGEDRDVGVDDVAVGRGHRARAHALEQRRHARRVAQPRAVVHVVRAEPGADQLLEEVGLLVRALGRAEARRSRPGRRRRGSR